MRSPIFTALDSFCDFYSIENPADKFKKIRYVRIPPLLLLSNHFFESLVWQNFYGKLLPNQQTELWQRVAEAAQVTNIAKSQPISKNDIKRRPMPLQPLYGDFGLTNVWKPKHHDFEAAFWVQVKQLEVLQTFAPAYTMFSKGNISEKQRIRSFRNVRDCYVVDLYAGIGYFALQYAQMGATVFCWDINPWSIEALKRGAKLNKMKYFEQTKETMDSSKIESIDTNILDKKLRIVAFHEDNIHAADRLYKVFNICHINLGILPSSQKSWAIAKKIAQRQQYCVVHLHALANSAELSTFALECESFFKMGSKQTTISTSLHIVKSYAPKKLHIVVDVALQRDDRDNFGK